MAEERKRTIFVSYFQHEKRGNDIYVSFRYNKGIEARVVSDKEFVYEGKHIIEVSKILDFDFGPGYETLIKKLAEDNDAKIVDTIFGEGLNMYYRLRKGDAHHTDS